jgi:hypothetical protein
LGNCQVFWTRVVTRPHYFVSRRCPSSVRWAHVQVLRLSFQFCCTGSPWCAPSSAQAFLASGVAVFICNLPLGSSPASTRPNILTSRSCILFWYPLHLSCCCVPWVFKQSWRRTRRRTALRILLVDNSRTTGVSSNTYRGRAEHKWQERRRRSGKREPVAA